VSAYVLIAKKDASTRRERRFPDMADVDRAIARWRKEGFSTWWLFAPRVPKNKRERDQRDRRLVRQWQD
jgi:hypothetical protein